MEICEHHDEPIFTFRSETLVDGRVEKSGFPFCRMCCDSATQISCQECGQVMKVLQLDDETKLLSNGEYRDLSCTSCHAVIASSGNLTE